MSMVTTPAGAGSSRIIRSSRTSWGTPVRGREGRPPATRPDFLLERPDARLEGSHLHDGLAGQAEDGIEHLGILDPILVRGHLELLGDLGHLPLARLVRAPDRLLE